MEATLCRSLVMVVVVSLTCVAVNVAGAQEGPSRASSTDDVARGLFEAGRASYGVGKYEDALKYLQQAYELSQRPGLLYNIGQAADRLHRDAVTIDAFRLYLERVPNSDHRLEVESRLRALERLVELHPSVTAPPQAAVDNAETHAEIRAETAATDAPPESLTSADRDSTSNLAPWLLLGAGGVTLATGTVLAWIGSDHISDVENARDGAAWSDVSAQADSGPTLATTGVVLLGVGAALSLTSVIWLLSTGSDSESLALGVHPGGLTVHGTL